MQKQFYHILPITDDGIVSVDAVVGILPGNACDAPNSIAESCVIPCPTSFVSNRKKKMYLKITKHTNV